MVLRLSLLAVLVLASGCDSLRLDGDTTFQGSVVDAATSDPIQGAIVSVGAVSVTTDDTGAYALTVEADSSGQTFLLTISAADYEEETVAARADVRDVVAVPVAQLSRAGTGGGTGGGSGGGASGPAASVTVSDRSTEAVGVTGAGGVETSTLEFVVLDAEGRPVDAANAVELTFDIAQGPGGGESISPLTATTDSDGLARVTLTSGTRSGTVQVLATATEGAVTLRSLPVTITITGGLPDDAHFSVAPSQLNFAGYNRFGLTDPITAFVGDKYGNPVQLGTAVYFTTDGGIIPGSGTTGPAGTTTVNLLSAAPLPSNPLACSSSPNGYARVTASTSDENQATLSTTATVLFSGVTTVRIDGPGGLALTTYRYTVSDQFGHPLAPGTQINVSVGGTNVKATGATSVDLGDFLCPGAGRTEFGFTVSLDDPQGDTPVVESIQIIVESPNGNVQLDRVASARTASGATDVLVRR